MTGYMYIMQLSYRVEVTGLSGETDPQCIPGLHCTGCARRDVEACERILPEGDENGIGGWRKQRKREREREGERGSRGDRRPAKQREQEEIG